MNKSLPLAAALLLLAVPLSSAQDAPAAALTEAFISAAALQEQELHARVDMIQRQSRLEKLEALDGDELMEEAAYIVPDPTLLGLRQQLIEARMEWQQRLDAGSDENHPDMKHLKTTISELERVRDAMLDGLKAGLRADYEVAREKWKVLDEEVKKREADIAANPSPEDALRKKFPEYFGLPSSSAGLSLYVWKNGTGELRCGLVDGSSDEGIENLKGATVEEMKTILSTYHPLMASLTYVKIVPFQHPEAVEEIRTDEAFKLDVRDMFCSDGRLRHLFPLSPPPVPPFLPIAPVQNAPAPTAVQALLDAFESVPHLSCEIRRDSSAPDQHDVRTLSRVFFERPDRLHSENILPFHRRTVCDGSVLRQYVDGLPRGFSRPVSALPQDMLVNLRMLPGSNANWLEPLRDLPETALPPAPDAPRRVAYAHSNAFVVLSFDADGRWFRFERFTSPDMTDRVLSANFSDFREIAPSVYLPAHQTVSALVSGALFRDDIRISALSTDPIPPSLFDSTAFFPNVEFTDSFEKTLSP